MLRLTALFLLLFLSVAPLHAELRSQFPNILLLYADDLGFGDLSVQNVNSRIPTPHLDGFAKTAVRFIRRLAAEGN